MTDVFWNSENVFVIDCVGRDKTIITGINCAGLIQKLCSVVMMTMH